MKPFLNTSTSVSLVWGITLAFLTLMDWNTLKNNPVSEDILTPFINRHITVTTAPSGSEIPSHSGREGNRQDGLQYQVELKFNGPLFLLCFFGPPLAFHGLSRLSKKSGTH